MLRCDAGAGAESETRRRRPPRGRSEDVNAPADAFRLPGATPCGLPMQRGCCSLCAFARPARTGAAHASARTLAASPTPRRLRGQPARPPEGLRAK